MVREIKIYQTSDKRKFDDEMEAAIHEYCQGSDGYLALCKDLRIDPAAPLARAVPDFLKLFMKNPERLELAEREVEKLMPSRNEEGDA